MKNWILTKGITHLCLLWIHLCFGQDPYVQKSNQFIRAEAVRITAQYQPRLVMGVDQALAFQEKVAEYLIRQKAVLDTDFSPRKKRYYLERLSAQETSEMADILERFRLEEYIRIKSDIQPLPLLRSEPLDSLH
ncbi:hypothetical protein U1E44_04815 [Arenibacter sp. GZD96]|uniref:hypothetical protein n=1 Tax=Aurantibrevibacter litoralis TaxID=3106030 RepID=UPI002AFF93E3|nr:hypothetical protein [Arenibacter sp. GZD-96]MEA1785405.1 hypothetical protein [Arenibacter sp. GZD-96]